MVKKCSVEDCVRKHKARGWCGTHYMRWLQHGSVDIVLPNVRVGPENGMWKKRVDYKGAHYRVKAARGIAADYACDCGVPAEHWAYDHSDGDELTGKYQGYTVTYSLDPKHYVAMCISCHKNFDLSKIKESA